LVEAILSGKLPSGSALHVAEIADDLKVSPSPVRDAIARLAAEGLATSQPNRRTTVTSFTRREVEEILQVREILECAATRLAAERIDPAGIARLRDTAGRCAALFGDPARKKEMLDLDHEFHLQIAEAGGNRTLLDEIVRVKRRILVMQWLKMTPDVMDKAYGGHMAVVAALDRHDPEGADRQMRLHIREALDFLLQGMAGLP
jgi:DNA-binding GntR family transcriptional regulator